MSNSNIKIKQTVPFLAVTNMEKSIAFYVDGLGFSIQNKWIDDGKLQWCWLQHGNGALMLQEFKTEGHDSFVPTGKLGEGITLYFMCEDAKVAHREITERGISAEAPFVGNNADVFYLYDPDGYKLSFESDIED